MGGCTQVSGSFYSPPKKILSDGFACRLAVFLTKEWTFQNTWHCNFWLH